MDFNAASLRGYIQQQGMKREDVATPFWPDADGHVALQDMSSDTLLNLNSSPLVKDDKGQFSGSRFLACLLCHSLIVKDTGELIYPITLTDFANRDIVASLGGSILSGVFEQAKGFFAVGNSKKAVETAKESFLPTQTGDSGTSSSPTASEDAQ